MRKYLFNDPMSMIELAREIQTRVYWGGTFWLGEDTIPWKEFWDVISDEVRENRAVGVTILADSVEFIY